MKKIIFGLFVIVTGIALFFVQASLQNDKAVAGVDTIFSNDSQVFNEAQDKFNVHSMGLSQEEKVMTVRVDGDRYKEQAESYFRELLDSNSMRNYELEIFADDLSFE